MGIYELTVRDGPPGVGLWHIWDEAGNIYSYAADSPQIAMLDYYRPGIYYAEIGTPYESVGNTGQYRVTLQFADDPEDHGV